MKEILEKIHQIIIITCIILLLCVVIAWPITMIFLAKNLTLAVTMVKFEIIVVGICLVGLVITDLLEYIINEK